MSQATKSINAAMSSSVTAGQAGVDWRQLPIIGFLPAILPLIGAALMVAARIKLGPAAVPNDGTLIILGQLSYIIAAACLVTNFWAPIGFLQRAGLGTASLGF